MEPEEISHLAKLFEREGIQDMAKYIKEAIIEAWPDMRPFWSIEQLIIDLGKIK